MGKYVVVEHIGSDKIIYQGNDENVVRTVLESYPEAEVYDIAKGDGAHDLTIGRELQLGVSSIAEGIRIHRNVLEALLHELDKD